ncbi:MAG: CYTH domain-containing protein [Candidatus Nealsonbacteria bacterium]|nr:CYTH domain-containing protein [Candidatus Nealsonbacteria bacterium]
MQKINLELKHYCKDFVSIRETLQKNGATNLGVVFQKDYFFNLPQNDYLIEPRLKLRTENGKQTLVFYRRGDFKKNSSNPANVYLYEVKDNELLSFLSEVLGIKAIVEKNRERWRKDNITFNLDDVNSVGKIFEIEIQTTLESKEKDEKMFVQYRNKFLKYLGDIVKGSNVDLVKKTCFDKT